MLFTIAMAAHASGTYTIDLPVVGPAPTGADADHIYPVTKMFEVAAGHPDQVVPSNWSYLTCEVSDGTVIVTFAATAANWPTTWPAQATCSASGYTLKVNLVPQTEIRVAHDRTLIPSVGILVDLPPSPEGHPKGTYRVYDLPVGPNYQPGTWPARLSPQVPWDGVQCTMAFAPNGAPALQLVVLPSAAANDGYCILQSASGVPHAIALELLR